MLTTLESHITGVRDAELSQMLVYAAESLDLTPTQFTDAQSKYKAVGAFLSEPETLLEWLSPVIWPHGSLAFASNCETLAGSKYRCRPCSAGGGDRPTAAESRSNSDRPRGFTAVPSCSKK